MVPKTLLLVLFCFAAVTATSGFVSAAEGSDSNGNNKYIAASLAMGIAAVGAGIAISGAGSASAGAVAEKPETFGKVVIFVALAEAIALYGLVVAIMILVS